MLGALVFFVFFLLILGFLYLYGPELICYFTATDIANKFGIGGIVEPTEVWKHCDFFIP